MIRVNLPTFDLFIEELHVLKHKRLARNIKEPLNIRGYVIPEGDKASYIFQTIAEWDGEVMLFEYRAPLTPAAEAQAEYEKQKPEVEREGDLRQGYFDSL